MKNYIYYITISFILLAILVMVSVITLYIFEQNPLTFTNAPFEVPKSTYRVGENIIFPVKRCSTRDIIVSSSQAFVRLDGVGTTTRINITSSSSPIPKGCTERISSPKEVPAILPEGVYKIEFNVAFKGRLKDFLMTTETTPFKVIR